MMKERFKVEKQGDNTYLIVQRTDDLRNGKFILDMYNEIDRKKQIVQAQIDNLPRQKELMEKDIKTLEKRMAAIKPYLEEINANIKKAEEKAKAEALKVQEQDREQEAKNAEANAEKA